MHSCQITKHTLHTNYTHTTHTTPHVCMHTCVKLATSKSEVHVTVSCAAMVTSRLRTQTYANHDTPHQHSEKEASA